MGEGAAAFVGDEEDMEGRGGERHGNIGEVRPSDAPAAAVSLTDRC